MAQVKESKQIYNHHSSTYVEEKKLSQPVSASDNLSSSELGTQASLLPSRCSSFLEYNSDKYYSNNNTTGGQNVASEIVKGKIAGDRGDVTEISVRSSVDAVYAVAHTAPSTAGDRSTFSAENFSKFYYKIPLTIKCLMLLVDTLTVLVMHNTIFNRKMTHEL
ncbi:CYIR protein [Plasmodium cynomolgi strain B]|uniref:CYIR protein n=1 Tax=Plasmodium cynomolgi (strain B) TaxID=1120755 RepID=K6V2D0_PLACD|nr:CYIR protein [Plasmodium cynomolgi strain B]GAB69410.1 CYIR protein [Plasmodium cynomolgi strain B]